MNHNLKATRPPQRLQYLDFLKVLASFAVVVIHVTAAAFPLFDSGSASWFVCDVVDSLCRWCVPVFLMVTGALLLNPKKDVPVRSVWTRRIPRYVAIYIAWSVVYALYWVQTDGWQGWSVFVGRVVAGEYHLWYLTMLVGVLALLPVLRALAANRQMLVYTCLLFLGLSFLGYVDSSTLLTDLRFPELLNDFHLSATYVGYCMLGYLLASAQLSKLKRWLPFIVILGIAGVVFTCAGTSFLSARAGVDDYSLYEYLMPNVAAPAAMVFAVARVAMGSSTCSSRSVLAELSGCSLGIYLLHPLGIKVMSDFTSPYIADSAILLLLWAVVLWLISLLLVFCWRLVVRALRRLWK